jgi:hypothetical protein
MAAQHQTRWMTPGQPGHAPETLRDRLKRCRGWGPLRGIEMWGDRARHPFKIFAPAVFQIALRIGTEIEGPQ